jgi:rubrerythrin
MVRFPPHSRVESIQKRRGGIVRARQGILSKELRWSSISKPIGQQAVAQEGLGRFLAQSGGLPRLVDAKTTKDQAVRLLRIAAEIEHALMVQYLYAAFTLGPNADTKFRRNFVTIAKQEMGHLVTVQNLLLLLGASPHLDRDDLLPTSGKEPGPFELEAVTPESLAKYTIVESPLDEAIRTDPQQLATYKRAKEKVRPKVLPHLNRVGALYVLIYWLFKKSDDTEAGEPWQIDAAAVLESNPALKGAHLKDEDFAPAQEVSNFLANRDEWRAGASAIIVEETVDRTSAKLAISEISAQGEGVSSDPGSLSHFQRFLDLFATAEAQPPDVIEVSAVQSKLVPTEAGQKLADFFNVRYQILLLLIDLSLRLARNDGETRSTLSNLAVDEMLGGIGDFASQMLDLSADSPTKGPVAPPFELPGGAWPKDSLPDIPTGSKRLRRLLTQARKLDQEIVFRWPGLIEGNLKFLRGKNAEIEEAIAKLPKRAKGGQS